MFEKSGNTADILMALSAISQVNITPGDTLLVLDEIQDCPKALEALKFFVRKHPTFTLLWLALCLDCRSMMALRIL